MYSAWNVEAYFLGKNISKCLLNFFPAFWALRWVHICGQQSPNQPFDTSTGNIFPVCWVLKAPYFSKIDILLSKERFNKSIYGINTIIICDTWQPVKFQLVSLSWNEMIFYLISELMLPTLTLKTPRKPASENVVCLCRLLNILANFSNLFWRTGKQCGPWSDCS